MEKTKKREETSAKCNSCYQKIERTAKVCYQCGRPQKLWRKLLYNSPISVSIVMMAIACVQLTFAFKERIDASKAVEVAKKAATGSKLALKQVTDVQYKAENILNNIEKQKEMAELWSIGTSLFYSHNYEYAVKYFENITTCAPENIIAAEFYGHSLLRYAEKLVMKTEKDKRNITLIKAENIWKKLYVNDEKKYSYDMACVYGLLDDKVKCKQLLQLASKEGTLPDKEDSWWMSYFTNIYREEWFKELKWNEPN